MAYTLSLLFVKVNFKTDMFENKVLTRSLTPTLAQFRTRDVLSNPVSHDAIMPHKDNRVKLGKRQVQPIQKSCRSSSGIRINDTNRSQFTIGHSDCLFSTHQSLQPRNELKPRAQGKQHSQAAQSKSVINLRSHSGLNIVQEKPERLTNIFT